MISLEPSLLFSLRQSHCVNHQQINEAAAVFMFFTSADVPLP